MPRLYGPGHFTEDPYSQVVSPHGIPVDDLVAVFFWQPFRHGAGFCFDRNGLHSGYSSLSMMSLLPSLTAMATTKTVTMF